MTMPNAAPVWDVEMLHGLPEDGNRYEIIDGELFVTPAPTRSHQQIVTDLGVALYGFARSNPEANARVFFVDADIARDRHTVVQPDVLVINTAKEPSHSQWPPMHCLMLAVEVLSPSTRRRDRTTKRALYLGQGVEYWIVDPAARVLERWLPGASAAVLENTKLDWWPSGASSALQLDVAALFAEPQF